jgi:TMEM175 potassium channel family protein
MAEGRRGRRYRSPVEPDPDNEELLGSVTIGVGRLEAFSDAVMAVIITITALTLRPPDDATWEAVRARLPELLIYVLSFTFVAIYWNNHHHLLRATRRISGGVMWSNMALLFSLSLIPVVTEWLRDEYREPFAAASFGIVALLAAICYTFLVRSIVRVNGRDSLVATAIASDVKGNVSLVLYALGVGLAVVSVWISYALYAIVAVMWLVPDRRLSRPQAAR